MRVSLKDSANKSKWLLKEKIFFFHNLNWHRATEYFRYKLKKNMTMRSRYKLEKYATEGFKSVEGWGIDEELINIICLIDQFQESQMISGPLTEIGVHHGRTLILLGLLSNENELTIGIDIFDVLQYQNLDHSGCGSYSKLLSNIAEHATDVKFEIVCSNSFSILPDTMKKMSETRIFHIDGGHFIEVVLNDLAIAQKCLHLGGVIIIDDYWHSGFPEVQEAVNKYFHISDMIKAVPFAVGKNKIFLVGITYKDEILKWFKENLPEDKQKPVKVLGYESICLDSH